MVGSILSGLAQNLDWLVAARAIQGLGGGGLTVTATALIGDVIPLRERGRYQGALGAVFGVTTVLGLLLSGFFTDNLSSRWDFYVNIPVGVIVVVLAARTLPTIRSATRPVIDYLGIGFIAIDASALILATSWGGSSYAWSSPTISAFSPERLLLSRSSFGSRYARSNRFYPCAQLASGLRGVLHAVLPGRIRHARIDHVSTHVPAIRRRRHRDRIGHPDAAAGRRVDVHRVAQRHPGIQVGQGRSSSSSVHAGDDGRLCAVRPARREHVRAGLVLVDGRGRVGHRSVDAAPFW